MYTLENFKNRWKERRVLKKVSKVFKMWYGTTTNIICAIYLPKEITEAMFYVLTLDISELIEKKLGYCQVENENDAKMVAILFEQYDQILLQGYQIFVKQDDCWLTRVGKDQTLKKVERLKLTDQDEFNSIFLEWSENVYEYIKDIQSLDKFTEVKPRKMKILYFA